MLSVSPSRSSLEEMLDSLRQRDEVDKPKDLPPALPARPTSKARRPSSTKRGPLPNNNTTIETHFSNMKTKEQVKRSKGGSSFGGKISKGPPPNHESPYISTSSGQHKQKPQENPPPSTLQRFRESELNDNIGYFIKKVILFLPFTKMHSIISLHFLTIVVDPHPYPLGRQLS